MSDLHALRDRIPGASFGLIKTMVSALLGGKMIIQIVIYLIFTGRIELKVETRVFAHFQNFDFHGQIYLKVGTQIL